MRTKLSGKKVLIFGGGGFIGSHLVKHLCKESCQINIISRDTKKNLPSFLLTSQVRSKLKKLILLISKKLTI